MMTKSMALLGTSLVGSMLGMTMPAHAQDAATPQMGVQDILVTARRQEESLQTTPIAVTALGEAALVRSQVVNVSDVQRTAPSVVIRSEEHTSELQSLMRISYAVFCLKKKKNKYTQQQLVPYHITNRTYITTSIRYQYTNTILISTT